jgi:hypothetical protein
MDINKHSMGEEIYIGDLEKEVGKIDGVLNLISLDIINEYGSKYSNTTVSQETIVIDNDDSERVLIDLESTDGILYNDGDTMMEILDPSSDIRIRVKER